MKEMATPTTRKGKIRKVSIESSGNHTNEGHSVNAYGVRYGAIPTGNASRGRFSRSTNYVAPFNLTSNVARCGFDLRRSSVLNRSDAHVRDLLKRNWSIHRASTMHNLDFSVENIGTYSRYLDEEIRTHGNQSNDRDTYSSELKYFYGCPSMLSVKLSINSRKRTRSENDVLKYVYEGHFLSWDEKKQNETSNQEEISMYSMPLFLCTSSGGVTLLRKVHHCLMKIFDIIISPVNITQEDMAWLLCLASSDPRESCDEKSALKEVNFEYDIRKTAAEKGKPSITLTHELGLIHQVWDSIHRNFGAEDEIIPKEVSIFNSCFSEHSSCSYGVNLHECLLLKVTMPSASFTTDGKLKISSLILAGRILRFLADVCAVENSITPSLGFSVTIKYSVSER